MLGSQWDPKCYLVVVVVVVDGVDTSRGCYRLKGWIWGFSSGMGERRKVGEVWLGQKKEG